GRGWGQRGPVEDARGPNYQERCGGRPVSQILQPQRGNPPRRGWPRLATATEATPPPPHSPERERKCFCGRSSCVAHGLPPQAAWADNAPWLSRDRTAPAGERCSGVIAASCPEGSNRTNRAEERPTRAHGRNLFPSRVMGQRMVSG